MTLNEFSKNCKSTIKVLSSFNGRVICQRFHSKKHEKIGEREVLDFWSDIYTSKNGFTPYIEPIICVFIHDDDEYINKMIKKENKNE